ncbi:MAG: 2-oxoacid:acceptor oxidoreductase subunit alpha [Candidatus Omnitrophica bacterium]|nr:2-oxoacid:acceptor oxidoreductase subunit alpha [Candidatus Omnitrophota bacterium]MDD5670265.1 2-oxoacid:acceptor oxidoreductase subunit alpha [Candidatus Omnitrophota bacterium]
MGNNELTVRVAGEAGQGMQTVGTVLCDIFRKEGFDLFSNQDYMSRIRGGNNYFQIRVSSHPLQSHREKTDILVALDRESVSLHRKDLCKEGVLVADGKKFNLEVHDGAFFDVPLYQIALDKGGSEIYVNSVSCGLIAGLIKLDFAAVERQLRLTFSNKKEDVINKNILAAKTGYEYATSNFRDVSFKLTPGHSKREMMMNGNDAIALGAIKAGCKFYSAYPMTPSTSILNVVSHFAKDFNILVEQAEDEIAAINMAIGASFAGVRAMTGTSGGGFALMVEGLSLAAMTETPVVIVDAQRPAPATGFPTRTEQSDLNFLIHAGHGEFARAIYAPGTIEQAFYLTIKAFNLAEKYQIPVLIMTDQHLADSTRNIELIRQDAVKVRRSIISKEESANVTNYLRYRLTKSGISPRAIPSWIEDVIYVDSDEHTEEGHITEEGTIRNRMVEKRLYKKMQGLSREIEKPSFDVREAKTVLIGFGSTYGVMKEVCEETKGKVGFVHLSQVWPFPSVEMKKLLMKKRRMLTLENNAGAQLAQLLRRETGIEVNDSILKYDGRPFSLDEVLIRLSQRTKRKQR